MEHLFCSHSQGNGAMRLSLEPKGSKNMFIIAKRKSETPTIVISDLKIGDKHVFEIHAIKSNTLKWWSAPPTRWSLMASQSPLCFFNSWFNALKNACFSQ
jgi:hypothetical protein